MFYLSLPGEKRLATESASLRPPEAGVNLRRESSGAQKQPRIPVSDSVSREGQLDLRCSPETGEGYETR